MMKIKHLIGLLNVALCIGILVACGGEDDNLSEENEQNSGVRYGRIAGFVQTIYDRDYNSNDELHSWKNIREFAYDKDGRITSYSSRSSSGDLSLQAEYVWGESSIEANLYGEYYTIFDLKDGKIVSTRNPNGAGGYRNADFSYDAFGHLSSILIRSEKRRVSFTWENDRLIRIRDWDGSYYELLYDKSTQHVKQGYVPPFMLFEEVFLESGAYDLRVLILAYPEMFGLKMTELPYAIDCNGAYPKPIEYRGYFYEFDNGYLQKCNRVCLTREEDVCYSFSWE